MSIPLDDYETLRPFGQGEELGIFVGLYLAPTFGRWIAVDGDTDPDEIVE